MRTLVIGATGMLGRDIIDATPSGVELVWPRTGRIDLTKSELVQQALDDARPDCVINTAGYTAVDGAEDEPDAAAAVNGAAVTHLAVACANRDITLVHFSTDYVFSGRSDRPYREDDVCEPVGAYARSKRSGELGILQSGARGLIIRTQWLFGTHGRSFPRTMVHRASARLPTRVVDDQVGRPTYTRDLSQWTWALVQRRARGIVHAANAGTGTWFDVARRIFEHMDAADLLSPCSTSEYPTRAIRPANSVLDTSRLAALVGEPRWWMAALDEFLETVSS